MFKPLLGVKEIRFGSGPCIFPRTWSVYGQPLLGHETGNSTVFLPIGKID